MKELFCVSMLILGVGILGLLFPQKTEKTQPESQLSIPLTDGRKVISITKAKEIVRLDPMVDEVVFCELILAGRVLASETSRLAKENIALRKDLELLNNKSVGSE